MKIESRPGRIELEMEEDSALSVSTSERQSLKTRSHFINYNTSWKHKRENCYRRMREDRTRLLWKTGLLSAQSLNNKNQKTILKLGKIKRMSIWLVLFMSTCSCLMNRPNWCPICKKGELQENCPLIYCSICQLQLSKCYEVNLDILQSRLAEAHVEHLDRAVD